MKRPEHGKPLLNNCGRSLALLFNRASMYDANHPYLLEAVETVQSALEGILRSAPSVVFILNHGRFYVDEEPLDSRLNVQRTAAHFKKAGIESISFYRGVDRNELRLLLEIIMPLSTYADAEAMKKGVVKQGIRYVRINHVVYRKVTEEDEVVSRKLLKEMTPSVISDAESRTKRVFLDTLLENVLMEEFVQSFNLQHLLKNPGDLSGRMVSDDVQVAQQSEGRSEEAGHLLIQQLEVIGREVQKSLPAAKEKDLPGLARALMDMRRKLIEGIESQKALGTAYSNENQILDKTDEITDQVLITLIREEYQAGQVTIPRLAQLLLRILPEQNDLNRLLPRIKSALLEEGMPLEDFKALIEELEGAFQDEGLAGALAESSEEIGVDSEIIIREIMDHPARAAELVYLASEIRKGGGDEKELTNLLVEYVEQIGSRLSRKEPGAGGEKRDVRRVMTAVTSNVMRYLGDRDIKGDVLDRLEDRVNRRMDDILDKLKLEWIAAHRKSDELESVSHASLLEMLERSIDDEDDLGDALKTVRGKVRSGDINENDFSEIYAELVNQDQLKELQDETTRLPAGIQSPKGLKALLEKEIAAVRRYGIPFSVLGFSLVKARARGRPETGKITDRAIFDALLYRLAELLRTADVVGEMKKNHFIALLPMTSRGDARLALRRAMQHLHLNPVEVQGVPLDLKVAGVLGDVDFDKISDAPSLEDQLSIQLKDMIRRIRTIHSLA